jgi:hypothetical protein
VVDISQADRPVTSKEVRGIVMSDRIYYIVASVSVIMSHTVQTGNVPILESGNPFIKADTLRRIRIKMMIHVNMP